MVSCTCIHCIVACSLCSGPLSVDKSMSTPPNTALNPMSDNFSSVHHHNIMQKLLLLISILVCCQIVQSDEPSPKSGRADSKSSRFFAGRGKVAIKGRLEEHSERDPKAPLYFLRVHAYGDVGRGKLILSESGVCPLITIRTSHELKPKVDYTFVGQDGGEDDPIFVVKELLAPIPQPSTAKP